MHHSPESHCHLRLPVFHQGLFLKVKCSSLRKQGHFQGIKDGGWKWVRELVASTLWHVDVTCDLGHKVVVWITYKLVRSRLQMVSESVIRPVSTWSDLDFVVFTWWGEEILETLRVLWVDRWLHFRRSQFSVSLKIQKDPCLWKYNTCSFWGIVTNPLPSRYNFRPIITIRDPKAFQQLSFQFYFSMDITSIVDLRCSDLFRDDWRKNK
jgi:hypothetical protein